LAPPLVVTREQIDEIVVLLDEAIGAAEREVL
jgi:adenosylmethionine-8-amino-7-oxononanoate aminotransferase